MKSTQGSSSFEEHPCSSTLEDQTTGIKNNCFSFLKKQRKKRRVSLQFISDNSNTYGLYGKRSTNEALSSPYISELVMTRDKIEKSPKPKFSMKLGRGRQRKLSLSRVTKKRSKQKQRRLKHQDELLTSSASDMRESNCNKKTTEQRLSSFRKKNLKQLMLSLEHPSTNSGAAKTWKGNSMKSGRKRVSKLRMLLESNNTIESMERTIRETAVNDETDSEKVNSNNPRYRRPQKLELWNL